MELNALHAFQIECSHYCGSFRRHWDSRPRLRSNSLVTYVNYAWMANDTSYHPQSSRIALPMAPHHSYRGRKMESRKQSSLNISDEGLLQDHTATKLPTRSPIVDGTDQNSWRLLWFTVWRSTISRCSLRWISNSLIKLSAYLRKISVRQSNGSAQVCAFKLPKAAGLCHTMYFVLKACLFRHALCYLSQRSNGSHHKTSLSVPILYNWKLAQTTWCGLSAKTVGSLMIFHLFLPHRRVGERAVRGYYNPRTASTSYQRQAL